MHLLMRLCEKCRVGAGHLEAALDGAHGCAGSMVCCGCRLWIRGGAKAWRGAVGGCRA